MEQESLIVQLLGKLFPQSHCHTYSPFSGSNHAITGSDILDEFARSLLQEVVHLVDDRSLHQKRSRNNDEAGALPSNDPRIIFFGHDLGGSVIKKVRFGYLSKNDYNTQAARLSYLLQRTRTFKKLLQQRSRLYDRVSDRSKSVANLHKFFFGTIHRARESDSWERQMINLLSVSQLDARRLFECIKSLPMALDAISDDFNSILGSMVMFNVYESRPNAASNVVSVIIPNQWRLRHL